MSKVTLKDTKNDIYAALVETENKLKDLKAGKSNPVEEAKVVETVKACESAAASVEAGIFSDDLNKKYNDVMTAIQVGENRIKELYGIDKELISLTTIINAHKDVMAALEENKAEKEKEINDYANDLRIRLNDEISIFRDQIREEQDTLRKNTAALKAQLELERKREKEEYSYNLNRERAKEDDAWEDEKAQREAAIATKEEAANKILAEALAKTDYITELEAKVTAIPSLIDEAKLAGATEKEKELGREYGYKKAMTEKEHEFEISRLTDKLDAAETDRDKAYDKVSVLEEKLDDAYSKIEALAGKTVEAAGGVKIIGSTNGTQGK